MALIAADHDARASFTPKLGKIYFYHFRNPGERLNERVSNFGGATIAMMYYDDDDGSPMVRFGVAKCSNRDMFCRRIGREMAKGRMLKERTTKVRVATPLEHQQTLENIVLDYLH